MQCGFPAKQCAPTNLRPECSKALNVSSRRKAKRNTTKHGTQNHVGLRGANRAPGAACGSQGRGSRSTVGRGADGLGCRR